MPRHIAVAETVPPPPGSKLGIGETCGALTVVSFLRRRETDFFAAQCECGRVIEVTATGFRQGKHLNCGRCDLGPASSPNMSAREAQSRVSSAAANPDSARPTFEAADVMGLYNSQPSGTRRCAICREIERGQRLVIDHCHATGKLRGLLCPRCNSAIGLLQDRPSLCLKASVYLYLQRFSALFTPCCPVFRHAKRIFHRICLFFRRE